MYQPSNRCWLILIACLSLICVVTNRSIAQSSSDENGTAPRNGSFLRKEGAILDASAIAELPQCDAVVDVTKPPYHAKGDGISDDTDAIQAALNDIMGMHRVLYFPKGTYLISRTLQWAKKNSAGREAWGKNYLLGHNCFDTIIKLKDKTFTDPSKPESMMWCGGFGSADWFHNYVENLTFDVGADNPGAIALQFYSNNYGAVRNCRFLADKRSGLIGLDLAHRDMNGPLLVKNCEVQGFDRGISCARAVNGQTFEHITLRNQRSLGLENEGQSISIRSLLSQNAVPAIKTYGVLCLVDSNLQGNEQAASVTAIVNYNHGRIHVRDTVTSGYSRAIADTPSPDSFAALRIQGEDKPGSLGPKVKAYSSHEATNPFGMTKLPQRLTVKEPPALEADPIANWANVNDFGADPTGESDSSVAIQKALDSGAKTIFLPGFYSLESPLRIRGNVQRLLGVGAWIDYHRRVTPDLIIEQGSAPVVTIEHLDHLGGGILIDTDRTVVLKSLGPKVIQCKRVGELFLEDVTTDDLVLQQNQSLWARQLNVENEGTHVANVGGKLWVLGYKTERGGTLLRTSSGGVSEIYGGFSYTTTAGKLAPMFITEDSQVFAFFGEVCYNGDPFSHLIQETRKGTTKIVQRGQGFTAPYIAP